MFNNSHFALASHALVVLAIKDDGLVTSAQLAESVGTNPAFLRTVLGRLREAGLVELKLGKGGGARLARPSGEISLLEVQRAVEAADRIKLHQCEPNAACLVGRNIVPVLEGVVDDVENAMAARLESRSVADLVRSVRRRG